MQYKGRGIASIIALPLHQIRKISIFLFLLPGSFSGILHDDPGLPYARLRMQHESQPSDRLRLRQLQLHHMFSVSQKLLLLILFKKIQNFFRHLIHIAFRQFISGSIICRCRWFCCILWLLGFRIVLIFFFLIRGSNLLTLLRRTDPSARTNCKTPDKSG